MSYQEYIFEKELYNDIENYISTSIEDNYELLNENMLLTDKLIMYNCIDDNTIRERIDVKREEILHERTEVIQDINKNIINTKIVKEGIFTHNILENIYKLFPNLQGRIYFDNANRTLIPVTVFNKIAELLLGKGATANDLNSVETIHAKIKSRSDYEKLITDVKDSFAKIGKTLPESSGPIKWFRNMLNAIKI